MNRFYWLLAGVAIGVLCCVAGCSDGKPTGSKTTKTTTSSPVVQEGDEHMPGPELSAEDKALADAQKFCPVSDEELGGMGPPVKEMVKGQPVFLCCSHCIKKLHANEDAMLAKVADFKAGKTPEAKPEETKPAEKTPQDGQPGEKKPDETKPEEKKPSEG